MAGVKKTGSSARRAGAAGGARRGGSKGTATAKAARTGARPSGPVAEKATRRTAPGKAGRPVPKRAATSARTGPKPPERKPAKAPAAKASNRAARKTATGAKGPAKVAKPPASKPAPSTRTVVNRAAAPRQIVRVRDLDPYKKCGAGTSVERLVRVDEMVDRRLEAHLVFLDRHGWYCEHGRSCHAVGHARKHRE